LLSAPETKPIEAKVCQGNVFSFINTDYSVVGLYSDTLTNNLGCDSIIYNINFDFYAEDSIVIEGDMGICDDESILLTITSNHDNVTLDNVEMTSDNILIDQPGNYLITGYDHNGCFYEEEFNIVSYNSPVIWADDLLDTVFSSGIALPVTYDGNITSYTWSLSFGLDCDDCATPILISDENTTYTIQVIDENGCIAEEDVMVSFLSSEVYLPNVIAKNPSRPENETLYLSGNRIGFYSLQVYDRWGNLLFDRDNMAINDSSQGWTPADKYNSGVYVYVIRYEDKRSEKVLVGDITVL